jgi:hypothetical protein
LPDDRRRRARFRAAPPGADIAPPASLNGRVREARGELKIRSIPGETSVTIRLPMEEAA